MSPGRLWARSLALAGAFLAPSTSPAARMEPILIFPGGTVQSTMPRGDRYDSSVVFELRGGSPGPFTVEARSLDFDTSLKVSRIEPGGKVTVVGQDDDSGVGSDGRFVFEVENGGRYRIEVTPEEEAHCGGNFDLSVLAGAVGPPISDPNDAAEVAYWRAIDSRARAKGLAECRVESLLRLSEDLHRHTSVPGMKAAAEQALEIASKELPAGHPLFARSLRALGMAHSEMLAYDTARPLMERSVEVMQQSRGAEHLEVARLLGDLGAVLMEATSLPEAKNAYERALAIQEKHLAPDHPDLGISLAGLARVILRMRLAAEARPLAERALTLLENQLGPAHPQVADCLTLMAAILKQSGEMEAAMPYYQRALAIYEKRLGPDDSAVGVALDNLAAHLDLMGFVAEALPLSERFIRILENRLGPNDAEMAFALSNHSTRLRNMGLYPEAKQVLERALRIAENSPDPENPSYAFVLLNMASVLRLMRSPEEARRYCERALDLRIRKLGPDHTLVAYTLFHLGALLREMGLYEEAKSDSERSLAIYERWLKPGNPLLSLPLTNLGLLHQDVGSYDKAKRLLERAMAAAVNYGEGSASYAESIRRLATLLREMGSPGEAQALYERALAIDEAALGPDHPNVAETLSDSSVALHEMGRSREALDAALRAERIANDHVRLTSRVLPESLALRYASKRARGLDLALSLIAARDPAAETSSRRILDALIRSRAVVLDEMAARRRDIAERGGTGVGALVDRLNSARERLAHLLILGTGKEAANRARSLLESARSDKERAEEDLARTSLSFRQDLARAAAGLEEVSAALPPDTALVSFAAYDAGTAHGRRVTAGTNLAYIAFVMLPGPSDLIVVSLGPASGIEALASHWRMEAARPVSSFGAAAARGEAEYRAAGEGLRRGIWDPIASRLRGARQVFIVPDGALHLVNFAALPIGSSEYLLERGPTIHYLSAERDLIAARSRPARGEGLLAVGGPAYDETSLFAALGGGQHEPAPGRPRPVASGASFRGERSACDSFQSIHFSALPASALESDEVAVLWRNTATMNARASTPLVLTGPAAGETTFKMMAPGHRVLHLATHGFFLSGACPSAVDSSRGIGKLALADDTLPLPSSGENPFLLSGLALAGANHRVSAGPGEDDGILTAEEIAALDLSGLEWAVLSACDTGLGEIKSGEGVFGLRRAFQVAGAATLIMSLWSVEDESARSWMRALYEARLIKKMTSAEAVREASLTVLHARRAARQTTHPFFWGGFVAAGDWR